MDSPGAFRWAHDSCLLCANTPLDVSVKSRCAGRGVCGESDRSHRSAVACAGHRVSASRLEGPERGSPRRDAHLCPDRQTAWRAQRLRLQHADRRDPVPPRRAHRRRTLRLPLGRGAQGGGSRAKTLHPPARPAKHPAAARYDGGRVSHAMPAAESTSRTRDSASLKPADRNHNAGIGRASSSPHSPTRRRNHSALCHPPHGTRNTACRSSPARVGATGASAAILSVATDKDPGKRPVQTRVACGAPL